MRTYLTRLSMTAAGVALSAVSLTGVANANDGDGNVFVDPSVLEQLGNLEPCDEITGSEDLVYPVDPDWEPDKLLPTEPDDPETVKPGADVGLVPCYQIPADPEDEGDEDGDDDEDQEPEGNGDDDNQEPEGNGDDDGQEPAGNGGTNGQSGSGSNGQSGGQQSGGPNSGDGVSGEGFGDTADDETSQPQETVTPTAATGNDDNGALMLAILAGVLGALGLFIIAYGLRKRPRRGQQPA